MIHAEDVYQIGGIAKPHGLRGEVVFHFTDDTFDRIDADCLILEVDGILTPFFIEEYRFRSDSSALMKFQGIDSVDDARPLVGAKVFLEKEKAAGAGEKGLSLGYFIGFALRDEKEGEIGTITDINDQTENWLFSVERPGGDEIYVPAHEQLIASVDHEKRTLTMRLPDGLLDI